jgi:hypothetical protein
MKPEPNVTGDNHEQKTSPGQVYVILLQNHYPQRTDHNKAWLSYWTPQTSILPGEGNLKQVMLTIVHLARLLAVFCDVTPYRFGK